MHKLQALKYLVDDVLLVDILQDVGTNHSMQISVHEVEDKINVSVILSSDDILESNDVFMSRQLLQENDFSESALSVSCVLKRIKVLFQCDNLLGLLVDGLPHDTVSTLTFRGYHKLSILLTKFLEDFVLLQHVSFNLFGHFDYSISNN